MLFNNAHTVKILHFDCVYMSSDLNIFILYFGCIDELKELYLVAVKVALAILCSSFISIESGICMYHAPEHILS